MPQHVAADNTLCVGLLVLSGCLQTELCLMTLLFTRLLIKMVEDIIMFSLITSTLVWGIINFNLYMIAAPSLSPIPTKFGIYADSSWRNQLVAVGFVCCWFSPKLTSLSAYSDRSVYCWFSPACQLIVTGFFFVMSNVVNTMPAAFTSQNIFSTVIPVDLGHCLQIPNHKVHSNTWQPNKMASG